MKKRPVKKKQEAPKREQGFVYLACPQSIGLSSLEGPGTEIAKDCAIKLLGKGCPVFPFAIDHPLNRFVPWQVGKELNGLGPIPKASALVILKLRGWSTHPGMIEFRQYGYDHHFDMYYYDAGVDIPWILGVF